MTENTKIWFEFKDESMNFDLNVEYARVSKYNNNTIVEYDDASATRLTIMHNSVKVETFENLIRENRMSVKFYRGMILWGYGN